MKFKTKLLTTILAFVMAISLAIPLAIPSSAASKPTDTKLDDILDSIFSQDQINSLQAMIDSEIQKLLDEAEEEVLKQISALLTDEFIKDTAKTVLTEIINETINELLATIGLTNSDIDSQKVVAYLIDSGFFDKILTSDLFQKILLRTINYAVKDIIDIYLDLVPDLSNLGEDLVAKAKATAKTHILAAKIDYKGKIFGLINVNISIGAFYNYDFENFNFSTWSFPITGWNEDLIKDYSYGLLAWEALKESKEYKDLEIPKLTEDQIKEIVIDAFFRAAYDVIWEEIDLYKEELCEKIADCINTEKADIADSLNNLFARYGISLGLDADDIPFGITNKILGALKTADSSKRNAIINELINFNNLLLQKGSFVNEAILDVFEAIFDSLDKTAKEVTKKLLVDERSENWENAKNLYEAIKNGAGDLIASGKDLANSGSDLKDAAKTGLDEFLKGVKDTADALKDSGSLRETKDIIKDAAETFIGGTKALAEDLAEKAKETFNDVSNYIDDKKDLAGTIIDSITDAKDEILGETTDAVKDALGAAKDVIDEKVDEVKDAISSIFGKLKTVKK